MGEKMMYTKDSRELKKLRNQLRKIQIKLWDMSEKEGISFDQMIGRFNYNVLKYGYYRIKPNLIINVHSM